MKGVPRLPKAKGSVPTVSMLLYEYRRCERNMMKRGQHTPVTFEQFMHWLEDEQGY